MVDTKNQYLAIQKEVDLAIHEVLNSASYINGKAVKDFAAATAKHDVRSEFMAKAKS